MLDVESSTLVEFHRCRDEDLPLDTFYSTLANNPEMQSELFTWLNDEKILQDTPRLVSILDLLLAWYRGFTQDRALCLQYLPHLLSLYLISRHSPTLAGRRSSGVAAIEAYLLVVYHTQWVDKSGEVRPTAVQVVSLSQGSVYHDGTRVEAATVVSSVPTDGFLAGGFNLNLPVHPPINGVNAQNRWILVEGLYRAFNGAVADLAKTVLEQIARNIHRLLTRGQSPLLQKDLVRVVLPAGVLLELLYTAYFCTYNGFQGVGTQVVEAIRQRGCAMASPEVLLTVNAVRTLVLTSGPSQLPSASITTPSQIAKNMITNASFRAKKIGDDIPKVEDGAATDPEAVHEIAHKLANMASISEELLEEGTEKTPTKAAHTTEGKTPKDKIKAKINTGILNFKRLSESDRDSDKSSKQSGVELKKFERKGTASDATPSETSSNAGGVSLGKKDKKKDRGLKASVSQTNNVSSEIDSMEQIEAMIQRGRVPSETIAVHSPESGTTIF